jgi:protein involved in ribonucleotide reduction
MINNINTHAFIKKVSFLTHIHQDLTCKIKLKNNWIESLVLTTYKGGNHFDGVFYTC